MYGLESKSPKERFAFDLELDIKKDPNRKKKIQARAESVIQEIKNTLREGTNEEDFDSLGMLLHGFTALLKVIKKVK